MVLGLLLGDQIIFWIFLCGELVLWLLWGDQMIIWPVHLGWDGYLPIVRWWDYCEVTKWFFGRHKHCHVMLSASSQRIEKDGGHGARQLMKLPSCQLLGPYWDWQTRSLASGRPCFVFNTSETTKWPFHIPTSSPDCASCSKFRQSGFFLVISKIMSPPYGLLTTWSGTQPDQEHSATAKLNFFKWHDTISDFHYLSTMSIQM